MNVKSRKEEQSAATRAALLKVARKLFAERGYADTATEEVVRRARVTRGALYHHFADKLALFTAVFDEEETRLLSQVGAASMRGRNAWERFQFGCEAFLDTCLDPAINRIVLVDAPSVLGRETWREMDEKYAIANVRVQLQALIDEGFIARQSVDPLAHILLGAVNEAAMLIAHAPDKTTARAEVGVSLKHLMEGLLIKRAKPSRSSR
jgi:AcrR family transcriptional regulator